MLKYYILFIFSFFQIGLLAHNFILHHDDATVKKLKEIIDKKEKGAFLRTGDGDIYLANGLRSGTHKVNKKLTKEMKEVFKLEGQNIIKSIPFCVWSYNKHYLKPSFLKKLFKRAEKVWGNDLNAYSPQFLQHYMITDLNKFIEFLKYLKSNNCSILIGNEKIPEFTKNLFFGQKCIHIKTPQKNPYSYIDKMEVESLKYINALDPKKFHIIIMAVGNTGRVLVKRIYHKVPNNVFFFDIGSSIDAMSNNKTRGWIKKYFNYNKFIEIAKNSFNRKINFEYSIKI